MEIEARKRKSMNYPNLILLVMPLLSLLLSLLVIYAAFSDSAERKKFVDPRRNRS